MEMMLSVDRVATVFLFVFQGHLSYVFNRFGPYKLKRFSIVENGTVFIMGPRRRAETGMATLFDFFISYLVLWVIC